MGLLIRGLHWGFLGLRAAKSWESGASKSRDNSPFKSAYGGVYFACGLPYKTDHPASKEDMRKALVDKGQAPHAAIIGCG